MQILLAWLVAALALTFAVFFFAAVLLILSLIPFGYVFWLLSKRCKMEDRPRCIWLALCCVWVIIVPSMIVPALFPVMVLVVGIVIGIWFYNHPYFAATARYNQLATEFASFERVTPESYEPIAAEYMVEELSEEMNAMAVKIALQVYAAEYREVSLPQAPVLSFKKDGYEACIADAERALSFVQGDIPRCSAILDAAFASVWNFLTKIPTVQPGPFEIEATVFMQDHLPAAVDGVIDAFQSAEVLQARVGGSVTSVIAANQTAMTRDERSEQVVTPATTKGDPARFLANTVFQPLLDLRVSFGVPDSIRTQHGFIVARSGGGKSQLIEALAYHDLLADDPPSMVIIDSKGGKTGLVERISKHKDFHPDHGRLRDRLIIIDPEDKPALNIFAVGDVQKDGSKVIESLRYFIGNLLGNELSSQMRTLFIPLMHIVLRMPGATLRDFRRMVSNFDPKVEPYKSLLLKIPEGAREFMEDHYNDKANTYTSTKSAIISRISEIVNDERLDELFGAPTNAFNMQEAIDGGKIVLIQTGRLGPTLGPLFGRYFIAQLYAAASARRGGEKRVHLYIDEARQYIDENFRNIFNELRSYNVGALVAFQNAGQMGTLSDTIRTSTSFQFVGSVLPEDAKTFAGQMRVSPDFILAQEVGEDDQPPYVPFAFKHSNRQGIAVKVPTGLFSRAAMDAKAYERLKEINRKRLSPPKQIVAVAGPVIDGTVEDVTEEPKVSTATPPQRRLSPPSAKPPEPPPFDPDNIPLGPRKKK